MSSPASTSMPVARAAPGGVCAATYSASCRPRPWLACTALALGCAFAVLRADAVLPSILGASVAWSVRALLVVQWLVETLFAFGLAGTTVISLAYLGARRARPGAVTDAAMNAPPRIAILYLCCGDLDAAALTSLRSLRHRGPVALVVHDDLPGGDPRVDELLATFGRDGGMPVRLLRRPEKHGSKAGAVNYALAQVGDDFDFVFLADNDSRALDRDCLARLCEPLRDPQVAVVQARNVKVVDRDCSTVNRIGSSAIEVFDLFLAVGSRHAWMPFVGHNALLRVRAVREVGGLLPGCFADDIDLTLRLNTRGHRVVYCPDVRFGERHPPSYAAFRKRSYKWACGSMQVLRRWLLPVLTSKRLVFAEKWGFVQFLGFYGLQALVLLYTALTFLVAPWCLDPDQVRQLPMAVAGTVLPLLVFLPVLAYALRTRWREGLAPFLAVCWLCYGATDFPTTRGVLHGLRNRIRPWVPTNSVRGGADPSLVWEAGFGVALLLVPLWFFPALLLSPLAFLVAGKFLAIPTMAELYQDGVRPATVPAHLLTRLARLLTPMLVAAAFVVGLSGQSPSGASVERPHVQGRQLIVDGQPYVVRGIHYGPWRPGTGPGRTPYPEARAITEDMAMIAAAHANTVFVFDAPRYVLDAAWERGVRVLCGCWLEWPQFGTEAFANQERAAVDAVRALHDHPAVLGWVLGNEIPAWLIAQKGTQLQQCLRELRTTIRAIDPVRPVTHANWPVARSLDLSFLDLAAFNLYALWPPEVVAQGYGNYVRDVLQPIAGDRPLLITEYGANSIEAGVAGQARLARDCWEQLRAAGAIGGFVFEFADEWWKNYSNPKVAGAHWDRETVLDDHLRHDEDPEESYGLVTGERQPKEAYAVVAAMYAAAGSAREPAVPVEPLPGSAGMQHLGILVGATLALAVTAFAAARWLRVREAARAAEERP